MMCDANFYGSEKRSSVDSCHSNPDDINRKFSAEPLDLGGTFDVRPCFLLFRTFFLNCLETDMLTVNTNSE